MKLNINILKRRIEIMIILRNIADDEGKDSDIAKMRWKKLE